ncbi:MAG TPA: hypothetical protein VKU01_32240 [Bryobacteraceae bacterium]|nr:hypothetical protein [Bryobacteraceae bacterium]
MAQPLIYNRSILNSASFMPNTLPGGAIALGSIFTISGARLGPDDAQQATDYPYDTSLANVSVIVIKGSTTVNAIPIYVSSSQINAIMPSNAPVGVASVRVLVGNARSNPMTVRIANSAFGIYTATGQGVGPGNILSDSDSATLNSIAAPALPGDAMVLSGTGLGPVDGGDNVPPDGSSSLPTQVEVFVGGLPADISYSGRAAGNAGVDQINFTVPDSAPSGCYVPVFVRTQGSTVSNVVTMAIAGSDGNCYNSQDALTSTMVNGGRIGGFVAVRGTTHQDVGVRAPIDVTADYHASAAYQVEGSTSAFNPLSSYPPPGTCTSYSIKRDLLVGDPVPLATAPAQALDLGPLFTLSGPNGMRTLTELLAGSRVGFLGSSLSNNMLRNTLFLDPGDYTVTSLGGNDVGAFSVTMSVPEPLTWTNRDQVTVIDRTQPLTLTWSGGDSNQLVAILGFGVDLPNNASTVFACLAPQGVGSFTVPPMVMSNMPAAHTNPLQSKGVVYLVSVPLSAAANLNAGGLDFGVALFTYFNGKTVVFQ